MGLSGSKNDMDCILSSLLREGRTDENMEIPGSGIPVTPDTPDIRLSGVPGTTT